MFAIPKGEFLCKSGEAKSEFFFILEGYAAIINGPEGMIKGILRPGDYLADEEEFNEGFSIYKVRHLFIVWVFKVWFNLKEIDQSGYRSDDISFGLFRSEGTDAGILNFGSKF